ncbi:MAG: hypothetical protein AAF944_16055 [Bacteroidota bacterium]
MIEAPHNIANQWVLKEEEEFGRTPARDFTYSGYAVDIKKKNPLTKEGFLG